MDIKRQEYKEFVQAHIFRPYQSSIFPTMRHDFVMHDADYKIIPHLVEQNPEWAEMVFNRISKIIDSIQSDFFPKGETRNCLLEWMKSKGVQIIHRHE